MIVTCEKCSARFRLADEKVSADGAKVRCSRCQHTFLVKRDEELEVVDFDDVTLVSDDDISEAAPAASPPSAVAATGARTAPHGKPPTPLPRSASGGGAIEWKPTLPDTNAPKPPPTAADLTEAETAVGGNPILFRKDEDLDVDLDFHDAETGVTAMDELGPPGPEFGQEVTREIRKEAAQARQRSGVHEAETKVHSLTDLRPTAKPSDTDLDRMRAAATASEADDVDIDMGGFDPFSDPTNPGTAAPSFADIEPFSGGGGGDSTAAARGIADVDPFAAAPSGSLEDELFADLQDPEPSSEPMEPFAGVSKVERRRSISSPGLKGIDAPRSAGEPRPIFSLVLNSLAAFIGGCTLIAGLVYFFGSDEIRAAIDPRIKPPPLPAMEGVQITSMQSVAYPRATGDDVLVVFGEARNTSQRDRDDMFVVAELRSTKGKVLATNRAPLGLPLAPPKIYALTQPDSLTAAFAAQRGRTVGPPLPAGKSVPFSVIILSPPPRAGELLHRLTLEKGAPILAPVPVAPVEPEVVEEDDSLRKGKRKGRKGKRKGGKGKRKRGGDEE